MASIAVALSLVLVVHAELLTDKLIVAIPLSFLIVGVIVSVRQPGNVEGRLLELVAVAWAVILVSPFTGAWVVPVGLMGTHLLLRFPDGHLPSPRWRTISWLATAVIVVVPVIVTTASKTLDGTNNAPNPYYVAWTAPFSPVLVLLPLTMLLSMTSLIQRYRRANDVQRHQIRWLAYTGSLVVGWYIITLTTSLTYDTLGTSRHPSSWFGLYTPWWEQAMQLVALSSFALIPAAFAVAILRYRLYDIDRIISRTVSYALATGLLVATYAAIVTTTTTLLNTKASWVVAFATLAAAGLARPLLSRVQSRIDKRFDRTRFESMRTADAFAANLRVVVNPDEVRTDLIATVDRTLRPATATLWVRE